MAAAPTQTAAAAAALSLRLPGPGPGASHGEPQAQAQARARAPGPAAGAAAANVHTDFFLFLIPFFPHRGNFSPYFSIKLFPQIFSLNFSLRGNLNLKVVFHWRASDFSLKIREKRCTSSFPKI